MLEPNRIKKSFLYALDGLYLSVKLDKNVRIHLIASFAVLVAAFYLKVSVTEFLFLLLAIFFVVVTEMVNTSIEEMTNLIKHEHHVNARVAKDIAAGAVLLSAVFATIVASIILLPRIIGLF